MTKNYVYLNYKDGAGTWNIVIEASNDANGNEIPYEFAKKVSKCPAYSTIDNCRILVKSQFTAYKENLLRVQ